jgi:hypothetical protein
MVCLVESVLHLEDGDVKVYLSPLNSLLEISERYNGLEGIFFHYTSFGDFLPVCNPEQSKDYCIDAPKCYSFIAQ